MTERIVNQLHTMNAMLLDIEEQFSKHNVREESECNGTISRMVEWMLTYGPSGVAESDISIQIRVQTPRAHKIYECKGSNLLDNKGDYIVIESDDSNKIEMINKDYVYNITLNIVGEE